MITQEKRSAKFICHLTPSELKEIENQAKRLGYSVSSYTRNVMAGYKIPESRINAATVRELLAINADQARLGNLFNMALKEDSYPVISNSKLELEPMFIRIEDTRAEFKEVLKGLRK